MIGNVLASLLPPVTRLVDDAVIHTFSRECLGLNYLAMDSATPSATWTANLVIYIPLVIAEPLIVSQFFWYNGTAVNGNTDVGIYSEDGATKLASTGSTANSGTSAFQAVDIVDVILPANRRLWLALGSDSGTQTYRLADPIVSALDFLGVKNDGSGWSSGLPATASFAIPTVAKLPICGFTGKSVF